MNRFFIVIAATLFVGQLTPVAAQSSANAEELAVAQEGEVEKLDLGSIRRFGEKVARFEVDIEWDGTVQSAPAGYVPRRVRYMADCEAGTMSLAAVVLFDQQGRVARQMVVPPGAADPISPEKGSKAAKSLRQVCMF